MTIELSFVGCLGPPRRIPAGREALMLAEAMRKLKWRQRLRAARAWQEAERQQAAEHSDAVRRILGQDRQERAA